MKTFLSILVFALLINFNSTTAQNPSALDSLWVAYKTQTNDSLKLTAANYLAFHYIFRTPSTADSILREALNYAKLKKKNFNYTELTNTRGIYFDVLSQKDSSKVYFEKALELSKTNGFLSLQERCINNLGMFNWNNGEFSKAIDYFYDALDFSLTHNPENEAGQAIYLNNIGLIYQELRQFEKAIEYHNKALAIRTKYNDLKDMARSKNNLAICYRNLGDYKKAEETIREAILYAEKAEQPKQFYQFHDNLGNILNDQKKYNEAIKAYLVALNVPEEYRNRNSRNEFIIYSNIIDAYNETSQYDKAKAAYKEGQRLIDQDSTFYMISASFYINSAKTFYATREKEKADELFIKYREVQDSLFSEQNASAIAEVETKLKTKEKEAELAETKNQLLEKELKVKQQNIFIYGGVSALAVLIILSYLIIRAKQLKNKQLEREAQLQKALAEIQLKNKLDEQRLRISRDLHDNIGSQLTFVISGLQFLEFQKDISPEGLKSKVKSISEFTQQTIHDLRDTIWAMNKEEIGLSELISRLNSFINRLSLRESITLVTTDKLKAGIEDINYSAIEGIQLYRIIQEAINNSVKHAEAEHVTIIMDKEKKLNISIKDDGKGFDVKTVKEGNGLKNMKARAERLNAKLVIESNKGEGSVIILSIPT